MDPWEAVKWIAIFRLILPDALFRLCGGRVENLGELQPLAVKAGLNGVMMGNFLTTLGNTPEEDRAMFEELGLNVARQPDNGANPRPDNRSGWLEGETPDVVEADLDDARARRERRHRGPALGPVRAAALLAKKASPGPTAPPTAGRRQDGAAAAAGTAAGPMTDIERRLDEIDELGLHPAACAWSAGRRGRAVVLDGKPVLLLCSNNYLGLADHPRVREAAADAAMRWGVGAGASRLVSGTMTIHRRLEEALAAFEEPEACVLFGSGYLANIGVVAALAGEGDVVFSDELNHASIIDGCRLSRAETFVYDHCDIGPPRLGLEQAGGRGALIVTDSRVLDGRRRRAAGRDRRARAAPRRARRGRRGPRHRAALGPGGRGAVAEAGLEGEVDVVVGTLGKALGSYGAFACCD